MSTKAFTVTLLDSSNDAPVSGASIKVIGRDEFGRQKELVSGYTDSRGQFSFTLTFDLSDAYELVIEKPGYITTRLLIDQYTPSDLTMTLHRLTQTITVRVVDRTNNNPIAGARVIVRQNQAIVSQATTNASGEAVFTLNYGTFTIHALAIAAGYRAGSIEVTIPSSDPVVVIDLTPAPAQTFTVRVVEARSNRVLDRALVVIKHNQVKVAEGYTDVSGRVQFTLPHDSYSLEVTSHLYQTASVDFTVPVPNNEIAVSLRRVTQTITFHIMNNANFAPVSNAMIRIFRRGDPSTVVASGVTDQQGRWTVTLEHDLYVARIDYNNRTVREVPFQIPSPDNPLRIMALFEFIIKVIDEKGNPIHKAHVLVNPGGNDYTNESGIAKIPIVPSRRFTLTVEKEGWEKVERTYTYGETQLGDIHDTIVLSPTKRDNSTRSRRGSLKS